MTLEKICEKIKNKYLFLPNLTSWKYSLSVTTKSGCWTKSWQDDTEKAYSREEWITPTANPAERVCNASVILNDSTTLTLSINFDLLVDRRLFRGGISIYIYWEITARRTPAPPPPHHLHLIPDRPNEKELWNQSQGCVCRSNPRGKLYSPCWPASSQSSTGAKQSKPLPLRLRRR